MQPVQQRRQVFLVAGQQGLGQLQLNGARRQAMALQKRVQQGLEARVCELAGRHVDTHDRGIPALRAPLRHLADGLFEHPRTDLQDQRGLLGHRNEAPRRHPAQLRTLPAQQGLGLGQAAGAGTVDGLVMQKQLALRHGLAQRGLNAQRTGQALVHAGFEKAPAAASPRLGFVHGNFGALQQDAGGQHLLSRKGHADAGIELEPHASVTEVAPHGVQYGLRARFHLQHAHQRLQARHDQRELIAAQACQQVTGLQVRQQGLCRLTQHLVTEGVAQGVVDFLEVVQIDQQHGTVRALVPARPQQGIELLLQKVPVGQPGELVGVGLLLALFLRLFAFAQVADLRQDHAVPHVHMAGKDDFRRKWRPLRWRDGTLQPDGLVQRGGRSQGIDLACDGLGLLLVGGQQRHAAPRQAGGRGYAGELCEALIAEHHLAIQPARHQRIGQMAQHVVQTLARQMDGGVDQRQAQKRARHPIHRHAQRTLERRAHRVQLGHCGQACQRLHGERQARRPVTQAQEETGRDTVDQHHQSHDQQPPGHLARAETYGSHGQADAQRAQREYPPTMQASAQ